ncbi:MAG: hypothetical protein OD918_08540 [Gammaproteobacteria bacterium]
MRQKSAKCGVQYEKNAAAFGHYVDTVYARCIACHICAEGCARGCINMGPGK